MAANNIKKAMRLEFTEDQRREAMKNTGESELTIRTTKERRVVQVPLRKKATVPVEMNVRRDR